MSKSNKTPKSIGHKYNFSAPPKYDVGDVLIYRDKSFEDYTEEQDRLMVLSLEDYYLNAGVGDEKMCRYTVLCLNKGYNTQYNSWYIDQHYDKEA